MSARSVHHALAITLVAFVVAPATRAEAGKKRTGCDLPMSTRATKTLTSIDGLERTYVSSECKRVAPLPGGSEIVRNRFEVYGDCDASEGSCSPPLQIITSPACQGSIDDLLETMASDTGTTGTLSRRRGVRVLTMEDGRTMHVGTGRLTISIFASSARRVRIAFRALIGPRRDPHGDLPREIRSDPDKDPRCHPDIGRRHGRLRRVHVSPTSPAATST